MFFGKLKGAPSVSNFHIYPSLLHMRSFLKLKEELREKYPDRTKSVKNTAVFEYMIEQLRGDKDEKLKEYIETRKKLAESHTTEETDDEVE